MRLERSISSHDRYGTCQIRQTRIVSPDSPDDDAEGTAIDLDRLKSVFTALSWEALYTYLILSYKVLQLS